jgi:hypothetical protein
VRKVIGHHLIDVDVAGRREVPRAGVHHRPGQVDDDSGGGEVRRGGHDRDTTWSGEVAMTSTSSPARASSAARTGRPSSWIPGEVTVQRQESRSNRAAFRNVMETVGQNQHDIRLGERDLEDERDWIATGPWPFVVARAPVASARRRRETVVPTTAPRAAASPTAW